MDKVEGLMRNLDLSVAERKGVRIREDGVGKNTSSAPVCAVGKLFSEKLAHQIRWNKLWAGSGVRCGASIARV